MSYPNPNYPSWPGSEAQSQQQQHPHYQPSIVPSYLPPPGPPPSFQTGYQQQSNVQSGGYPASYNSSPGFTAPQGPPPRASSPYGSSYQSYASPSNPPLPSQHNYNPNYIPLPQGQHSQSPIPGYPSGGLPQGPQSQSLMPTPGYPSSGRVSPSTMPPPYQSQPQPFTDPGGFVSPINKPLTPRPDALIYLGVPIPPPPPAPPYTGSLPGFDAYRVSEAIRKAFRGFGTDEKALSEAIAPLDAYQVDSVNRAYQSSTGKDLIKSIEKETSSWYEYALRAKALGPVGFDCWLLHRASSGFGTHEDILTEVLCDRTNSEILTLKAAYQAIYRQDLSSIIRSELSMKTERLFNMILVANRNETEYVDSAAVQADVRVLYAAGPGRKGTDEVTICSIIATRSHAHLRALVRAYHQTYHVKLSTSMRDEFSGHMKTALEYVVKGAEEDGYGVYRDAVLIHEAMQGLGTKDERLIYRVIRAHWNKPRFDAIKQYFQELYGKSLLSKIRSEISGDYRDFMCFVIA